GDRTRTQRGLLPPGLAHLVAEPFPVTINDRLHGIPAPLVRLSPSTRERLRETWAVDLREVATAMSERSIFMEALEFDVPRERAAYIRRACGGGGGGGGRRAGPPPPAPAGGLPAAPPHAPRGAGPPPAPPPPRRALRDGPRPLHVAPGDRRRRDGHRLPGRADAARQAAGRAEGDQGRHGHAPGDRPVRGRAAGAGADGPSQHRPGPRRR